MLHHCRTARLRQDRKCTNVDVTRRCVVVLKPCNLHLIACAPRSFSCPDPALPTWCGNLRDPRGKLLTDATGKAQSLCVSAQAAASCPATPNWASKAVSKTQTVPSNSAAAITVARSDGTAVATLNIAANTISEATFLVASVADSVYQAGAFSTLFLSGRLRSPLISVVPNGVVDSRSGGVTLTMAVDIAPDKCINATSNMKVCAAFVQCRTSMTHCTGIRGGGG